MLSEMLQIALLVLGSLGGGGLIIVGLSGWLGKVWADRITQKERAAYEREIEDFKAKAVVFLIIWPTSVRIKWHTSKKPRIFRVRQVEANKGDLRSGRCS